MSLELDDRDFEIAEQKKRHKQLMSSLSDVAKAVSSKNGNAEIAEAIKASNKVVENIAQSVSNLKIESPEVEVIIDNKDTAKAISDMCEKLDAISDQNKKIIEILQIKKKIKFTLDRDKFNGNLTGGEFFEV